jgi:hypothetical protein
MNTHVQLLVNAPSGSRTTHPVTKLDSGPIIATVYTDRGTKASSAAKDRSTRIGIDQTLIGTLSKLALEFHNEASGWFFPLRSDKIKRVHRQSEMDLLQSKPTLRMLTVRHYKSWRRYMRCSTQGQGGNLEARHYKAG